MKLLDLKNEISMDLYNQALYSIGDNSYEASARRRYIIELLKDRGETQMVYSLAINLA